MNTKGTVGTMGNNSNRPFSATLLALQLQLKTLLQESGGEHVMGLLDALCALSGQEQEVILGVFTAIIKKIAAGDVRIESAKDAELNRFENELYLDLVQMLKQQQRQPQQRVKLEVLPGGKHEVRAKGAVLDLCKYRETEKQLLN